MNNAESTRLLSESASLLHEIKKLDQESARLLHEIEKFEQLIERVKHLGELSVEVQPWSCPEGTKPS